MQLLDSTEFERVMRLAGVRARLRRELRFAPDAHEAYDERELVAVADRAGKNGVLLMELDDALCVAPYTLLGGLRDPNGRAKPAICDFCYTWQRGGNVGRITFTLDENRTLTFVCCADLLCSLHVRDRTPASILSRTQLHEDITIDRRIERLRTKLSNVVSALGLQPSSFSPES